MRSILILLSTLTLSGVGHAAAPEATTCETLRARIETQIRDAGVQNFRVDVVDAAASAPGQLVGNCGLGTRKIMYVRGSPTNNVAPAERADTILTECKDGTVSKGGSCGSKP
jgi:hypothetical protein